MKLTIAVLCMTVILSLSNATPGIQSPDGRVRVEIGVASFAKPLPRGEYLYFQIKYDGKTLVRPSPIRLLLQGASAIGANLIVVDSLKRAIDESSETLYGKSHILRNFCNEWRLFLRETVAPHRDVILTLRAYNDGAAFRITIPRQRDVNNLTIQKEETYIRLQPATAYALPLKHFRTPYENNYKILPTAQLTPGMLIGLPFLIHINGGPWIAITEANLYDYPGMYLSPINGEKHTLISTLAPSVTDTSIAARLSLPHNLPWRVFMIAEHPGRLIESNLILNLNPPGQIENPCWIRPGKAVWPWWSNRVVKGQNFEGGMNTATMKHYIDFAATNHLEYLLIDAGWYGKHDTAGEDITTTTPEIQLPEIIQYAADREVAVLLWVNWQCVRDQMDVAFPLYQKWGVAGVKVDYMNRDDQEMVNFYHRVVKTAAQYHLIVDFHGAYKPTGLRRTYPNLLTREGVLGLEWSKWSNRCDPEHETILPFTRMLTGPMDFTPGAFRTATRQKFKPRFTEPMAQGTRAHQLAMYVVYESPLQMIVDYPGAYRDQPGSEFLKIVPTVWDETRFLDGNIGDYVVIARRSGKDWYLGAMTDWSEREIPVNLSFLGTGSYQAHIFTDSPHSKLDPNFLRVDSQKVTSSKTLNIYMAPGGGCAIRFTPIVDKER